MVLVFHRPVRQVSSPFAISLISLQSTSTRPPTHPSTQVSIRGMLSPHSCIHSIDDTSTQHMAPEVQDPGIH